MVFSVRYWPALKEKLVFKFSGISKTRETAFAVS
jgi:hypothetical protein